MTETMPASPSTPELSDEQKGALEAVRKLSPRFAQTCENIAQAIVRRGDSPADEPQPTLQASGEQPQQLPLFQESFAIPNAILRAALFPARDVTAPRRFVKKAPIFAVEGIQVTFTGEEFDQTDLDVLLGLLEIGAYVPIGQKFTSTVHFPTSLAFQLTRGGGP